MLAASALIGIELSARAFTTNDHARFPVLAQDILARGDWLWPRLNGAVYHNKPPLLAWLIAATSWPQGHVTELTAVLPSAVSATGVVWLTYMVARDLFDPETGRYAALFAMTMQGLFFSAHLALPDTLMTAFITASVWMLVRMVRDPGGRWWIGFYGCVGAAFWAKGPGGLLPVAVGLVHRIATRSDRRWTLRLVPGLLLVSAIVTVWVALGAADSTRDLSQAVVTDQLAWYRPASLTLTLLTAPLRNLAVVLVPWTLLVPLSLAPAIRACREPNCGPRIRLPLVWLLTTIVLIGVSREQRLRYYVPVVPPAAILLGWWVSAWLNQWLSGANIRPAILRRPTAWLWSWLPLAWMCAALGFAIGYHVDLEHHERTAEYRAIAERVRPLLTANSVVAVWDLPELPLAFYLGRPVTRLETQADLRRLIEHPSGVIVVASETGWAQASWAGITSTGERTEPCHVILVHRRQKVAYRPSPWDVSEQTSHHIPRDQSAKRSSTTSTAARSALTPRPRVPAVVRHNAERRLRVSTSPPGAGRARRLSADRTASLAHWIPGCG